MINKNIDNHKCLFSSVNSNFNKKYIQSSKFLSNDSFLLVNEKSIIKYHYNYNTENNKIESVNLFNEYKEKDYIYDYDIIYNNSENPFICLCSKDNPIRILNEDLSIVKSFSLENKIKEKFLSSAFIKYEEFGVNIFTGKNFLSKIDLIKQKEVFTKFNKNYNYLSCFDFNPKYSCYFIGSYSNNLLMCDYKTDKIIEIFKQEKPINEIKLLNSRMYQMLIGYRNSDFICLFDIRNMNKCINKLERNALTTKKINFVLDKDEKKIYCGNLDGNIIKYSFNNELNNTDEYENNFIKEEINYGNNKNITSIDLENKYKLLLVTYGKKRNTILNSFNDFSDSEENIGNENEKEEGNFNIYKI